jgi:hypothetical protein
VAAVGGASWGGHHRLPPSRRRLHSPPHPHLSTLQAGAHSSGGVFIHPLHLQTTLRADARRHGAGAALCPLPPSSSVIPAHSHPVSTLQAVARGGGAGCWLLSVFVGIPSSPPHPPSVPPSPLHTHTSHSTPFHPTSNCLWQRSGVLHGAGVSGPFSPCLIVVIPPRPPCLLSFHQPTTPRAVAHGAGGGWCCGWWPLSPCSCCRCHSTNHPPPEQLLMGLEVGVSPSSPPLLAWPGCRPLSPVYPLLSSPFHLPLVDPPLRRSTHQPPHEQLLVRLGWVVCWLTWWRGCGRGHPFWGCFVGWVSLVPSPPTSSSSSPPH